MRSNVDEAGDEKPARKNLADAGFTDPNRASELGRNSAALFANMVTTITRDKVEKPAEEIVELVIARSRSEIRAGSRKRSTASVEEPADPNKLPMMKDSCP